MQEYKNLDKIELLSAEQMMLADKKTIAGGIKELQLIRNAGQGLAEETIKFMAGSDEHKRGKVAVFCGSGNNGADGLVAAQHLSKAGHKIKVICVVDRSKLTGERAILAAEAELLLGKDNVLYKPELSKLKQLLGLSDLVIDAIFGTGLSRPPQGYIAGIIQAVNSCAAAKVAVDIPSGLSCDLARPLSDAATGAAVDKAGLQSDPAGNLAEALDDKEVSCIRADMTVTFFRPKICHYLYPAAAYCGKLRLVQIGIKDELLPELGSKYSANHPNIWQEGLSQRGDDYKQHKYKRGHVLIIGGNQFAGAGILAAMSAANSGAGLVTIYAYRRQQELLRGLAPPNIMVRSGGATSPDMLADSIEDRVKELKASAVLLGPGQGVTHKTAALALQLLAQPVKTVLDADVFSSFAAHPGLLLQASRAHSAKYQQWAIMTPHEGEFARIFSTSGANKIEQAVAAAKEAQAVIVLKGADTVIALPNGEAIVNNYASRRLAVGGSGDVLAGLIAGFLAQGLGSKEACGAGVWLHAQAAASLTHNFTPQELAEQIRHHLSDLQQNSWGAAGQTN